MSMCVIRHQEMCATCYQGEGSLHTRFEDKHILHGEETSRYEHHGFLVPLSYYITLHAFIWSFLLLNVFKYVRILFWILLLSF